MFSIVNLRIFACMCVLIYATCMRNCKHKVYSYASISLNSFILSMRLCALVSWSWRFRSYLVIAPTFRSVHSRALGVSGTYQSGLCMIYRSTVFCNSIPWWFLSQCLQREFSLSAISLSCWPLQFLFFALCWPGLVVVAHTVFGGRFVFCRSTLF